jgi:transcription initiation factor IIE alpha subunit
MNPFIDIELTELETKTLNTFVSCLYAEPGFSDVDANDLSEELGISTKIIRGVLGSLVKKGLVTIDNNGQGYDIIYLNTPYWYLVNENWAEEAKEYLK